MIAMNTIDYIYQFDPKNPSVKPSPPDTEAARKTLEDGNRMFAKWMESCRTSDISKGEPGLMLTREYYLGMESHK